MQSSISSRSISSIIGRNNRPGLNQQTQMPDTEPISVDLELIPAGDSLQIGEPELEPVAVSAELLWATLRLLWDDGTL